MQQTSVVRRNGLFENPPPPWGSFRDRTFFEVLLWQAKHTWIESATDTIFAEVVLDRDLPVHTPRFSHDNNSMAWTWLGHSSGLIQLKGVNILIDPIFSERMGPHPHLSSLIPAVLRAPFSHLLPKVFGSMGVYGPRRCRPSPCTVEELPVIDVIVISHDHFDHLDYASCAQLVDKAARQRAATGRVVRWIVPSGVEKWLFSHLEVDPSTVIPLTWWQSEYVSIHVDASNTSKDQRPDNPSVQPGSNPQSVKITCVPAQHWSGRSPFDRRASLWSGFVFEYASLKVYYSGDTAYCEAGKEIGQSLGPMDLSIIPIGAYCPRLFAKVAHVSPAEAVQIHDDVKSKRSVAVHWGTFVLSDEHCLEPRVQLGELVHDRGWAPDVFRTTAHGETVVWNEL